MKFLDVCAAEVDSKAFNRVLTLTKGVQVYGEPARKSIAAEIEGIKCGKEYIGQIYQRLRRRRSYEKSHCASEKDSSRRLLLGNLRKEADLCDDKLTSPTPSIHTILIQATRAAAENREVITFDVGQAFLNAQLETIGKEHIVLRLSAPVAEILIKLDNSYKQYMYKGGTILVKLKKALYGLGQAPRILFDTIRAFLLHNGFQQSELNDCFFWKHFQTVPLLTLLFTWMMES